MPIHPSSEHIHFLHLNTSSKGTLLLHCSILFRKHALKFKYFPLSWEKYSLTCGICHFSDSYHFRYLKNGEMCAFRFFPPRANRIYSIISHGRFQSLNCTNFSEYILNCSSKNWTLYLWWDLIKMEFNRTFFYWFESYNHVNAT